MGRPAKHPIQVFNAVRYYLKPSGYFVCNSRGVVTTRYLHRAVWESAHGGIPPGMAIHHKDHDKANNDLANLELIPIGQHARYHGRKRASEDPEAAARHMAAIRPAASQWHASPEGKAWHEEHGKRTWVFRPHIQYGCIHCGCEYWAIAGTRKAGYCSPACQSAARRASGIDNETRACAICERPFTANRYAKTLTCSKDCWRQAVSRGKRKGL